MQVLNNNSKNVYEKPELHLKATNPENKLKRSQDNFRQNEKQLTRKFTKNDESLNLQYDYRPNHYWGAKYQQDYYFKSPTRDLTNSLKKPVITKQNKTQVQRQRLEQPVFHLQKQKIKIPLQEQIVYDEQNDFQRRKKEDIKRLQNNLFLQKQKEMDQQLEQRRLLLSQKQIIEKEYLDNVLDEQRYEKQFQLKDLRQQKRYQDYLLQKRNETKRQEREKELKKQEREKELRKNIEQRSKFIQRLYYDHAIHREYNDDELET